MNQQALSAFLWSVADHKNHGAGAEAVLLDRLRKELDGSGTLAVLRHGIELLGLKQKLALAQFKPALAMNPDLQARYAANRLRAVRQLRYSVFNENAIDLVLFLNGIPVATVELKTDFTQSVEDAVDQYRFDRNPRPKGQAAAEPLSPSAPAKSFSLSWRSSATAVPGNGDVLRVAPGRVRG